MQVNTALFLVDLCLLPCFGYLSLKIGKERMMRLAAISLAICAVPLFMLLEGASLGRVICVRLAIIVLSIAFAAPYYAWAIERVPKQHRYLLLSLGGALGSQLIGMPTSAVCLWLYKISGWSAIPGVYLMIVSLAAALIVKQSQGAKENGPTPHLATPQSDSPSLLEK
jgi:MFS family permease